MTLMRMKWFSLLLLAVIGLSGRGLAGARILCLGDSLTEGYGISQDEAWPARLKTLLVMKGHSDVEIINAGVSGSTSASGVSRLRWHLKAKPDILILALGANDGLRGVDPDETQKNLSEVLGVARENGLKVLLTGMKIPPNYGLVYKRRYDSMFLKLAKRYDTAFMPFLLKGVAADPAMNLPDGIHPNPRGHQQIAETILPHVLKLL